MSRATVFRTAVALAVVLTSARAHADDPTTADCLTANENSTALWNQHQLRATRAQLLVCSASSCPADIRNECTRRVADINQAMPTIVFEARDAGGHTLVAVSIKADGQPLAQRLEGTALSIDPGEHTFTFTLAGQPPIERTLLILEGEKDRRERVVFESVGAPSSPTAAADDKPRGEAAKPRRGKLQLVGLAAAGVGVAALAVSATYGLVAISRRNAAAAACPGQCADAAGVALWNRARDAGDVATVALFSGMTFVAAGTTLWLLGKPDAEPAPKAQVGFGPGYVEVMGRW
jgi:hypothetical protein